VVLVAETKSIIPPTTNKEANMAVNLDKPHLWKADIIQSVDMYNDWFIRFAPQAFRETRLQTTQDVEAALRATKNLTHVDPSILRMHPEILPTLRMSACPPLAVDRLIGLAEVPGSLVKRIENRKKLPVRLRGPQLDAELRKIGDIIERMADPDIFVWLHRDEPPTETEIHRSATAGNGIKFNTMPLGTFHFHMNVPVTLEGGKPINIPVDAVVMPKASRPGDLPLLFEAKSAGDFTNVNKRRKEEAAKMAQLRRSYGNKVRFNLFLCGYFDSGYLGYEAAEGID